MNRRTVGSLFIEARRSRAKAAITRALIREGAGVVVNYRKSEALAPALKEELGDRVLPIQADVTDASAATPQSVFDLIASSTPMRRVTTPEEFADAVLFFLSPWARAVTGQNLIMDGGLVKA
ncbi:MAG: 3-oxoacyl-[acyl-carrier protein] reductase [Paraburkholderia sp.]|jgi:NAD(P)-dependent dehydrogenase (short-subunit alcohol dehydrogenase family)|nr:3-oxoacyl-[acyl-carrier protein] reductase [Paraburkholderia sp.]